MNQVTNLIQLGLLTAEQQRQYDFEDRRLYDVLRSFTEKGKPIWESTRQSPFPQRHQTYRLKILPDEWYVWDDGQIEAGVSLGSEIMKKYLYKVLRPAKPSEIPKPEPKEPTLLERIEEKWGDKVVNLLSYNVTNGLLSITDSPDCDPHTMLPAVKGFAGYVYDAEDGPLLGIGYVPVCVITGSLPIAVLFNK